MAKATIGGVDYEVRPFKLREIRLAAPAIDRVTARAKSGEASFEGMTDGLADMLAVVAVGLDGVTADQLEAELDMADVPGLRATFNQILTEAGFKAAGEAKPAAGPAGDPSPNGSDA